MNVEFAQPTGNGEIRMRVWERGSGITQACGTGACATFAAAVQLGKTDRPTVIRMDGGSLTVDLDENTGNVRMKGDAVMVFEGNIIL
jgi:diaminopimelate epimerase